MARYQSKRISKEDEASSVSKTNAKTGPATKKGMAVTVKSTVVTIDIQGKEVVDRNRDGVIVNGVITAQHKADAANAIKDIGIMPFSITEKRGFKSFRAYWGVETEMARWPSGTTHDFSSSSPTRRLGVTMQLDCVPEASR